AGTMGAASHEQRLKGFQDTIAKYPNIEIVDTQRDNDSVEKAISITESWLQAYPDLGGILCNNMSNPVGACQAVKSAGKSGKIVIGGMDHDLRTLNYLKDGTLYVAQVQNCYDMGYKLIYNAIKTVDGQKVDEKTAVGSTSVYKGQADKFIKMLYGDNADAKTQSK
ncbi:MAG TPA: sugar ABC transporter substrate-binding protein, partial [Ruminococcaceae bacterium]|nr:sugar ABC transporter substrate-binding protein [Oscillospiraceae bacterium]